MALRRRNRWIVTNYFTSKSKFPALNNSKEKDTIRRKLLERRQALSQAEYDEKSHAIVKRLREQPAFDKSETIHCYVSINERKEVNTHFLIQALLDSKKKVVVPVTNFDDNTLSHYYLERFSDLKKNRWNVPEPTSGRIAGPAEPDLVIVPMVGGDLDKNRLGYGKGFYDRFLKKAKGIKIGLLFERCLVDRLPSESFDVPMDKLVTEGKVID